MGYTLQIKNLPRIYLAMHMGMVEKIERLFCPQEKLLDL